MAGLGPRDLHEQIGCAVCHGHMVSEWFSRRDRDRQLDELFKQVQISQMFLCGCQRIESSDARHFLALLDRTIFIRPGTTSFRFIIGNVPLRKSRFPHSRTLKRPEEYQANATGYAGNDGHLRRANA